MYHSRPRNAFTKLNRQVTGYPHSYATVPPRNIAVIGGGITGLAVAYWATRLGPPVRVTLYEKEKRLGGWLNTKRVNVKDGTVYFEQGPRSFRPVGTSALVMKHLVGYIHQRVARPQRCFLSS